jgi:hypothetical protein
MEAKVRRMQAETALGSKEEAALHHPALDRIDKKSRC